MIALVCSGIRFDEGPGGAETLEIAINVVAIDKTAGLSRAT